MSTDGKKPTIDQWNSIVQANPQLAALATPMTNKYMPHKPHPKQAAFLMLQCKEAFYGGGAGSGKSDALLMAALQYVHVPGYSALILRRTYAELALAGNIMDRAKSWMVHKTDAKWNETEKKFRFPSGAVLTFGYLERPDDLLRYQGAEFGFIGWDELTQFASEDTYTYMFSRLRAPDSVNIPLRVRSASNPGGPGSNWVYKRFIGPQKNPARIFIPALFNDNPSLNKGYKESLEELSDPVQKARLLHGDWSVTKVGLVYPEYESCIVPPRPLPDGEHFGGIDFGFHNPFAALAGVLDGDDVLWIYFERYRRNQTIQDHARHLPKEVEVRWFADPSNPEGIMQLRREDFCVRKATNNKDFGILQVANRIATGRLKIFSTCEATRQEFSLYRYPERGEIRPDAVADPTGERLTEDPIKENDHAMDALKYLCAGIAKLRGDSQAEGVITETVDPGESQPHKNVIEIFDEHNWHSLNNPYWFTEGR